MSRIQQIGELTRLIDSAKATGDHLCKTIDTYIDGYIAGKKKIEEKLNKIRDLSGFAQSDFAYVTGELVFIEVIINDLSVMKKMIAEHYADTAA